MFGVDVTLSYLLDVTFNIASQKYFFGEQAKYIL